MRSPGWKPKIGFFAGVSLLTVLLLAVQLASYARRVAVADFAALPLVPPDFTVPGTVDTATRRVITSPNVGALRAVMVREGMRITAGQVVARLGSAEVLLRRDIAARKLALLRRRRCTLLERARLEPSGSPTAIDLRSQLMAARADRDRARVQLELARKAFQQRSELSMAVDAADLGVQSARQALDASLAQVKAAEAQLPIEIDRHESVKSLFAAQAAAREELRAAEQRLQQVTATVNTARAAYNRDLMALRAAQTGAAAARKRREDGENLREQVLASEARYGQADAAYQRTLAQVHSARATVKLSPDIGMIDTEIVQAQAELLAAQEGVHRLELVAPVSGIIADWQAEAGESVAAGQALGTVVNLERLKVTTEVRPEIAQYLRLGKKLSILVPGPPTRRLAGRVSAVSPVLDPQQGTHTITIAVFDPKHELVPGSAVSIQSQKQP